MRATVRADSKALVCLVPPLILQPLVENAVRHGISSVSSAGRVDVTADLTDGRLLLSVRDDGPGFQNRPPSRGTGTGLRNTRERLTQLYGHAALLEVASDPDSGTAVRIELPARVSPAGVETAHG